MLSGEAKNIFFIVFGLILSGLNPQSTAIKVSTLTITPLMPFSLILFQYKFVCYDSEKNMVLYLHFSFVPANVLPF
jgi:hypothetical protein